MSSTQITTPSVEEPFSGRRWMYQLFSGLSPSAINESWSRTDSKMQRAIQSDQMQGKAAFWLKRPFDDALHCMDAPEYIPSTRRSYGGGMIIPLYTVRGA